MSPIAESQSLNLNETEYHTVEHFPARFTIAEVRSLRYEDNRRPQSWDKRLAGNDVVTTVDGKVLRLSSDGGQSPPSPGWVILISGGDSEGGYLWTLYGIPGSDA